MSKVKASSSSSPLRKRSPALTPEAEESQLISLAVDLAKKQLMEGTASSQVITHYLKLGSTRERLERAKLEEEVNQLRAKTESLKAQEANKDLYEQAIKAMRNYSGNGDPDEY